MTARSKKSPAPQEPARTFAVMDVGSSAIRLALADLLPGGGVRKLNTFSMPVDIGRDIFTSGLVSRPTIELCVHILRGFKQVMAEFGLEGTDQLRAVATSALREAGNCFAFLDRLYMATGINVEQMDDAETTRLTFLSVQPDFENERALKSVRTLVAEVGSGNTEVLVLRGGNLLHSSLQRMGSLRLHELAETSRLPGRDAAERLGPHVDRGIMELKEALEPLGCQAMLALGGEARLAASSILGKWDTARPALLRVKDLEQFTRRIMSESAADLAREFHLPFTEAENLGPALFILTRLAQAFRFKFIRVSGNTMRDGLLREAALGGVWTPDFIRLVEESVLHIGRKYQFDEAHAQEVAGLAGQLFAALQREHRLPAHAGLLLRCAAMLHEIGGFVSPRSHHKHSHYLILNSDIFGLGQRDISLTALVARYHRRAPPRPTHPEYMALPREDRLFVSKLAAILRVADAIARATPQHVRVIHCRREEEQFVIRIPGTGDLSLERFALRQKGGMFEDVYGFPIVLEKED